MAKKAYLMPRGGAAMAAVTKQQALNAVADSPTVKKSPQTNKLE